MKKKINSRFFILVMVSIILTMTITTVVYYKTFQAEVMEDLRSYTHILEATQVLENEGEDKLKLNLDNVRITVIKEDGTVTYDSDANVGVMENHRNRPEVIEAFNKGEGKAIRTSSTMDRSTYYYAVKMKNGSVLRISKESGSILSIFESAFPIIAGFAAILFAVCIVLAHYLTKSILMPIKEIAQNMDNMDNVSTYKEIMPFINVIKKQHEDILKSAKMRQEFTANVSHELKTPLASISGYSELIENGMATESDVTRFAGEIHSNSQRLLLLINDILRLSQLDSQDMEMVLENVDLYDVAEKCKGMLTLHADDNDVEISLKGKKTEICANRQMVEEVIYNLCDNAIRYNHPGGHVWITIENNENEAKLTVEDDGIGIPQKDLQRIFERFYRVDKSRSKKTGGTGLGLAIVKHIIEQLDAKILVESKENVGTKITAVFKK